MTGSLFIITAASGTGKTSLVKQLLATTQDLTVSISHTTREPRVGEIDGEHYYFVDKQSFIEDINTNKFMEYAEVFGNYYGTSQAIVTTQLDAGLDVILEIDWQGALQVKNMFKEAIMIFILPPSLETLEQRLSNRGQDSKKIIMQRLAGAVEEMKQFVHFDYLIINDDFDTALSNLRSIIIANRHKLTHQMQRHADTIESILNSSAGSLSS